MKKVLAAALPMLFLATTGAAHAQMAAPQPAAPAEAVQRGGVLGVGLYVSDPERSLKFYRDTLGMKVMMQFAPPAKPGAPKQVPDVVLNGGKPTDPMLMLLHDRDPKGPRKIEHGFGFARVVVFHTDLAALAAKLRENGFTAGNANTAHGTVRVMMINDPDGYLVEVIEQKPAAAPPR
jgi:lactoylglutathione lyase